jgi:hypothetical protein
MRLTEQDLLTVASVARTHWHSIPTEAKLAGSTKSHLDSEQRTTVAWIEAVVGLLQRKGVVGQSELGALVDLEIPDNEPPTEP